jgi:translocation and assembly module TamB
MWHFDIDPRFDQVKGVGKVKAKVHYVLGGKEDRCGDGALRVDGSMSLARAELFEERYDGGDADFHFDWPDRKASYMGFDLDVTSMTLKKGRGTLLGSLGVRQGGKLYGHLVGTAVPISRIDAMGGWALPLDGRVSAVAEIGGTVDQMTIDADARISPINIGAATLPASHFSVKLAPPERGPEIVGTSRCGNPITAPFDRGEYDSDRVQGVFHSKGEFFAGQIRFDDFQTTRQRKKTVRGKLDLDGLDLGALAQLYPKLASSDQRPSGKLSAKIDVESLPLDHFALGKATATIKSLGVEQGGLALRLVPSAEPVVLADRKLRVPHMGLTLTTPGGQTGTFDVHALVASLDKSPDVDATLELRPVNLSALANTVPRIQRAEGSFGGKVRVHGAFDRLDYSGSFDLKNGSITVKGLGAPITDLDLGLAIDSGEIRIARGSAKFGGGTLALSGSAPLRGFALGGARATLTAREVSLPSNNGVEGVLDADLVANWQPNSDSAERNLPELSGDITFRSLAYTRPLTMSADIESLTQRGKRTQFEAYDPSEDALALDLVLRSAVPLKIRNNLVDAELNLGAEGLALSGTNQRFGLRGLVRLKPGGRIRLRRNEFEIREGFVRFDDPTRIAPEVDVTAATEYKRYSDIGAAPAGATTTTTGTGAQSGSATSASGGRWLIKMHAHGDADKLRIDLSSEPTLSQDDIFLLLTVGLTRAELDQARSASVGESVALEALGTLTGADRAVTEAVPVIDEFRFGSAYSSRAGRTEPTITIGKRLADRIRASVTSGVAESREVRSNVEWQLNPNVSVEGSYDNVNDISSSSLGNLGADVRWRLEF